MKTVFPGVLPAMFALAVVGEAVRRGASKKMLLADAALAPDLLAKPESPIAIDAVFAIWEAAMRRVHDDGMPVAVARTFTLEDYPILGFAVMTSATAREALARVVRFHSIVSPGARWSVEEKGELARLRWHREGPRTLGHRVANESAMAEMVHAMRQTIGTDVSPLSTSFRHAAPRNTKLHKSHFGTLSWDSKADEVVFLRSVLDAVPRLANPAMAKHFDRQAERLLADTSDDAPLPDRVRSAVERSLPSGEPASTVIAKQLAMSERTLRRALATDGTSFRTIVEDVRKERATLLLGDKRSSLAEIALSLGFSELSAFSRAFKRWTGLAPSDARAQKV